MFHHHPAAHGTEQSLIQRMRQMFANHQRDEHLRLASLPDRQLRDLGLKRIDIASVVEREIGRLHVDEFRSRGWAA